MASIAAGMLSDDDQQRLDFLLSGGRLHQSVEPLKPPTETLLKGSHSTVTMTRVMPSGLQRPGVAASLPVLAVPSMASNKRKGGRALPPGIIGHMRRTDHERMSATNANAPAAESWLDDMLDLIYIREEDSDSVPSLGAGGGLIRARLDRAHLRAQGLSTDQVAQLHQSLFVHTFGLHQSLEVLLKLLRPQAQAVVSTRFVRSLVAIFERLLRTSMHSELVELLHGMEDEVGSINDHAQHTMQAAKALEDELRQTIRAALRRADAAEVEAAEAEAKRLTVLVDLSQADAEVARMAEVLADALAGETEARESLSALRIDFMRQKGAQSAEEANRAAMDGAAKATLSKKLLEGQATISDLEGRLASELSAHEETRMQVAALRASLKHESKRNISLKLATLAAKQKAVTARAQVREGSAQSNRLLTDREEEMKALKGEIAQMARELKSQAQRAGSAESVCVELESRMLAMRAIHACLEDAACRETTRCGDHRAVGS